MTGWEDGTSKKEAPVYAGGEGYDSTVATTDGPTLTRSAGGTGTSVNSIIVQKGENLNQAQGQQNKGQTTTLRDGRHLIQYDGHKSDHRSTRKAEGKVLGTVSKLHKPKHPQATSASDSLNITQIAEKINNTSKVVDENGELLVVHHGTDAEFNTFKSENNAYFSSTMVTKVTIV